MTQTMWKIIEICKEKRILQKELAEKAGITEASISRYFNGDRDPNTKKLESMANALGYEIAVIKK